MKCEIEGVIIRDLKRHNDNRGWLVELFRQDEMDNAVHPVMSYVSLTQPGITRGPHEHKEQTDLFCFIGPSTFRLYLWDNRKASSTFGKSIKLNFGESHWASVLVPPGVVHGYRNIGLCNGLVYNAADHLYAGKGHSEPVDEIRHEDNPDSPFIIED